jgi:hypothetical protein
MASVEDEEEVWTVLVAQAVPANYWLLSWTQLENGNKFLDLIDKFPTVNYYIIGDSIPALRREEIHRPLTAGQIGTNLLLRDSIVELTRVYLRARKAVEESLRSFRADAWGNKVKQDLIARNARLKRDEVGPEALEKFRSFAENQGEKFREL